MDVANHVRTGRTNAGTGRFSPLQVYARNL